MYFRELHDGIASLGLRFLASLRLEENFPELCMPEVAFGVYSDMIAGRDYIYRESMLDLIMHSPNRMDLYGKGTPGEHSRLLDATDVYLQRAGHHGDLEARRKLSAKCAVDLTSDLHVALLDLCDRQVLSAPAVLQHPDLQQFEPPDVERAMQQLFAKRFLSGLTAMPATAEYDRSRRYRLASGLNQMILSEQLASSRPVMLASTLLGEPLQLPEGVRVRLQAFLGGDLTGAWRALLPSPPEKTCTNRTPRSTSRRAIRHCLPNGSVTFSSRPYSFLVAADSRPMSTASGAHPCIR
jgi:hypothetical protein